jgi:hypothetical protein
MKNYDPFLDNESYQGSIKECFIIAVMATLAITILAL